MARKTGTTTKERIGRVGQRRQVVLPRELFEQLKMRDGDFVAFAQKQVVDRDDVLTPAEEKIVRRGIAQLKRESQSPGANSSMNWHVELSRDAQKQLCEARPSIP
jgi:hypothetical protein